MHHAGSVFLMRPRRAPVWHYLFTQRKMSLSIPVVFYEVLIE